MQTVPVVAAGSSHDVACLPRSLQHEQPRCVRASSLFFKLAVVFFDLIRDKLAHATFGDGCGTLVRLPQCISHEFNIATSANLIAGGPG